MVSTFIIWVAIISPLLSLHCIHRVVVAAESYDDDSYESKIQTALSHHATDSRRLLERSLREGGAHAAAALEVGPDGAVASGSAGDVDQEIWQSEFAIQALEREIQHLKKLQGASSNRHEDDDSEDDDSADGDSGDGDSGDWANSEDREGSEDASGDDGNDGGDLLSPEDLAILERINDEHYRNVVYNNLVKEADIRYDLDDSDYPWFQYTYWELHAHFTCHRVMAGTRPVYDSKRWGGLRSHYNEFVKRDLEGTPPLEGEEPRSYKFSGDSFDAPTIPFDANDITSAEEEDEEKGRGLKAARDISKGELVFKATNNTVIFTHGHTWRKFLFEIYARDGEPYDAETTCDFLVWSWVQPLGEEGKLVIVSDLDNGSLLNEGRVDDTEYEPPNVRCGKEGDKICMMSYYATKDIKEGEELLCDYAEFALIWSWTDMGL